MTNVLVRSTMAFALRQATMLGAILAWACTPSDRPERTISTGALVSAPAPLEGPLASLPAKVKAMDFRVNPPEVLRIQARPASNGQTSVEVKFARDQRLLQTTSINLFPNDQSWMLRDDGVGSDRKAGDGVFTTTTPIPFSEILDEQRSLRKVLTERQIDALPRFRGSEIVGRDPIAPLDDPTVIDLLHSTGVGVLADHSLTITAPSVVEDPLRTAHPCTGVGAPLGAWSFGHLITEMANGGDPATLAESFLNTFVPPATRALWPKRPDGHLDPTRVPVKLLAIVNRIDLAGNVGYGAANGAELRFVFEFSDVRTPACLPQGHPGGPDAFGAALFILEYGVPIDNCLALRSWAESWMTLSGLALGTSAFNDALAALTETVVVRNAAPSKAWGSALNQLRTNEINFSTVWNLSQFQLSASGFVLGRTSQTPDDNLFGAGRPHAPELASWVNGHASEILDHTHTVPTLLGGLDFLAERIRNDPPSDWPIPGAASNEVRHAFSLDTCNGCHGTETGTRFVQVGGAGGTTVGAAAPLSGFLRGETIPDPEVPSVFHSFNELARRARVLDNLAASICLRTPDLRPIAKRPRFRLPIPPIDVRPTLSVH